jgi:putative SOS response-associated peptidase YedK
LDRGHHHHRRHRPPRVHDRTPLILPSDRVDDWLDPTLTDPNKAKKLLKKIRVTPVAIRPVSRDIGKVGNNRPDLIETIEDAADSPLQLALA